MKFKDLLPGEAFEVASTSPVHEGDRCVKLDSERYTLVGSSHTCTAAPDLPVSNVGPRFEDGFRLRSAANHYVWSEKDSSATHIRGPVTIEDIVLSGHGDQHGARGDLLIVRSGYLEHASPVVRLDETTLQAVRDDLVVTYQLGGIRPVFTIMSEDHPLKGQPLSDMHSRSLIYFLQNEAAFADARPIQDIQAEYLAQRLDKHASSTEEAPVAPAFRA